MLAHDAKRIRNTKAEPEKSAPGEGSRSCQFRPEGRRWVPPAPSEGNSKLWVDLAAPLGVGNKMSLPQRKNWGLPVRLRRGSPRYFARVEGSSCVDRKTQRGEKKPEGTTVTSLKGGRYRTEERRLGQRQYGRDEKGGRVKRFGSVKKNQKQ